MEFPLRYYLSILISVLFITTSSLANDKNPHHVLSELLNKAENLKPGQAISIFDLQKFEKASIEKLKKIAKTNPKSFLKKDAEGKTVAMRAAHAGLLNTLAEIIKIPVINRSLKSTRDNRGFSTADQVVTAPSRTLRVCKNSILKNNPSVGLWSGYTSVTKSYEKILSAFVNKVPTNPRTVATTWLKECPTADQNVRTKMAALSKENSSKKIQKYLLEQDKNFSEKLRQQKENEAIAKSNPNLDAATASNLSSSQTRKIGPIELARNPNGEGVLIAKINGDRSKLKADTNGQLDIYASVGHRVTHIEYIQLSSLKDVDKALTEFRGKSFKNLSLTLYIGENYGRKVIDITVPFK